MPAEQWCTEDKRPWGTLPPHHPSWRALRPRRHIQSWWHRSEPNLLIPGGHRHRVSAETLRDGPATAGPPTHPITHRLVAVWWCCGRAPARESEPEELACEACYRPLLRGEEQADQGSDGHNPTTESASHGSLTSLMCVLVLGHPCRRQESEGNRGVERQKGGDKSKGAEWYLVASRHGFCEKNGCQLRKVCPRRDASHTCSVEV